MGRHRNQDALDAQVIALHASGRPYAECGAEMGIAARVFARRCWRLKLPARNPGSKVMPADFTAQILKMRTAGLSTADISKMFCVGVTAINRRIKGAVGPASERDDAQRFRLPLPAGSPETWGAISATPWSPAHA